MGWVAIDDAAARIPNGEHAEGSDLTQRSRWSTECHMLATDDVSSHPVSTWNCSCGALSLVFVCWGFHNKTLQTGGAYKQWTFTSHGCGGWASKVKVPADSGSGDPFFLVRGWMSSCWVLPCWRGGGGSLGISFTWTVIPSGGSTVMTGSPPRGPASPHHPLGIG